MDFGTALSTLIKPQPQFPDPTTILALANNIKYPLSNYNLPNYGQSMIQPRQQTGIPSLDMASILAAATANDTDNKLLTSLASVFTSNQQQQQQTPIKTITPTSTPTSISNNNAITNLSQLPMPIPAQPTSPTQSSSSTSSILSIGTSQNSPVSSSTSGFAGFKRKLNGTPLRKPPAPIPDEKKDDAYYERRRKNNDAAKRSRDARRLKEEQTAAKAAYMEQENIQLRAQIQMLKNEMAKLQMLVITQSPNILQALSSNTNNNNLNIKEELKDSTLTTSSTTTVSLNDDIINNNNNQNFENNNHVSTAITSI